MFNRDFLKIRQAGGRIEIAFQSCTVQWICPADHVVIHITLNILDQRMINVIG